MLQIINHIVTFKPHRLSEIVLFLGNTLLGLSLCEIFCTLMLDPERYCVYMMLKDVISTNHQSAVWMLIGKHKLQNWIGFCLNLKLSVRINTASYLSLGKVRLSQLLCTDESSVNHRAGKFYTWI